MSAYSMRNTVYIRLNDMDEEEYFNTVLRTPRCLTDKIKGLLPMKVKFLFKIIKLWLQH